MVLAACGSSQSSGGTATTTGSKVPTRVTLTLALVPPKMIFMGFYVAKYEGFFARNGLNVTLQGENGGVQAARGVASGTAQFAAGGTDAVISSAAANGGQIAIWSYGKNDLSIIADNSIKTISQLRGMTLGTGDATGPAYQGFVLTLGGAGIPISAEHVAILAGRPALVGSLVSNRIQASIFHIDDGLTALSKDKSIHILVPLYKTAPQYWYGAVSVTSAYAKAHPAIVEEFLTAMVQADRWMYTHAAQTIALSVKYTGEAQPIVAKSYQFLAKMHAWTTTTNTTKSAVNFTAHLMYASKQIQRQPAYSQLYDPQYINAVLSKIGNG